MIRFYLFSFLFVALNTVTFGAKISYTLKMPRPQNHYFQVEMQVEQLKQKTATVKLPVWSPGSYLVREFSRHLNQQTKKKIDKNESYNSNFRGH